VNRTTPQAPPEQSQAPETWELVIADAKARNAFGVEKYGVPLRAHNGRDQLVDAYQEALDLAAYLRTALEERPSRVDVWNAVLLGVLEVEDKNNAVALTDAITARVSALFGTGVVE